MAVEYSLLTALGLTTNVTLSTADTITLTNHGLRTGHAFRFLSTSTTLPQIGGVTVSTDTVYYVSATDNTANSFKISSLSDGSDVLDITNAGSGVKIVGNYWASLPDADPGNGGNYKNRYERRVISTLSALYGLHTASTSKDIVLEVEGAWTDTGYMYHPISGFKSVTVWSRVRGVRSSAFHDGVYGNGYVATYTSDSRYLLNLQTSPNSLVEGLTFLNKTATGGNAIQPINIGTLSRISKCILQGISGVYLTTHVGMIIDHNIFYKCVNYGYAENQNDVERRVYRNIAFECGTGYKLNIVNYTSSSSFSYIIGNIAIKSVVKNWAPFNTTYYADRFYSAHNYGESSDIATVTFDATANTVLLTGHGLTKNWPIRFIDNGDTIPIPAHVSGESVYFVRTVTADTFTLTTTKNGTSDIDITGTDSGTHTFALVYDTSTGSSETYGFVDSGDFVDYTNGDLHPVSTSSFLDIINLEDFTDLPDTDISDNPVPSYQPSVYPNEKADAGPYEYDHGNGLAPEVLTISDLTTGSRVIATRADTGALLGTATESSGTATISIAYSGTVKVEARNASSAPYYKPWGTQISFPATKNVIALQEVD